MIDGSSAPWFLADVAIRGDSIVAVGRGLAGPAARTIDVGGSVIAPGFIDLHTHARRNILNVPTADNYVRQGVTTLIEGPDGGSPIRFEVRVRIDTPKEREYFRHGGILHFVLRQLAGAARAA